MEIDGNATLFAARCMFGLCRVEACEDVVMIITLKIGMLHLYAALLLASSDPNDRGISPQPEEITRHQADIVGPPLPKRIIVKDFTGLSPLNDTAIVNLVNGKKLSNTPDREFVARLFVEEFKQSGLWVNQFGGRTNKRDGTWRVKGNKLCVSTPLRPELCRSVFIDQKTGEIWLSEYESRVRKLLHKIFILNE